MSEAITKETITEEQRDDAYEKLHILELEIEEHRGKFLRYCGWVHSSSHPDCCWRWSKSFGGVNYSLGTTQAISLEVGAVR